MSVIRIPLKLANISPYVVAVYNKPYSRYTAARLLFEITGQLVDTYSIRKKMDHSTKYTTYRNSV